MPRLRRLFSCSTAAVALLVFGCDRDSSAPPLPMPDAAALHAPTLNAVEPEPASDPDPVDDTSAVESSNALAADVPLYGHAIPISSMSSPQRGTIVDLRSDDSSAQVATWYGSELPARGWELEKHSGAAGSFLVTAHKGGRKATVLITGGAQGTQILITVLEDR